MFLFCSTRLYFNRLNLLNLAKMDSRKKANLSKLSNAKQNLVQTKGIKTENIKTENIKAENVTSSSPYFSPRQTRNQRKHVKVEYEREVTKPETKAKSSSKIIKVEPDTKPVIKVIEIKKEAGSSVGVVSDSAKQSTPPKRKSATIKEEITDENEKQSKWEPKDWQQMLDNMREMRKNRSAPVDTMGCHKCSDSNADEKTQRFHHLIALMLSSQTKDQVTFEAMERLKSNGLTPETVLELEVSELEKLLYPVSFYKNKTKHIQATCRILIEKYGSDIPNNIAELIKLPGVGPKMAHICMHTAWNIVSGIGVDTHVHRISNRLRWLPKQTKEPEKTRIELEKWIPFELWWEVNELMVGFGQTICTPTHPKCDSCLNNGICPSAVMKKK